MPGERHYTQAEREHIEELSSAYVLGSLVDDEEAYSEFESLLRNEDPFFARTLEAMFEASIILAEAAPIIEAPEHVRTALFDHIKHAENTRTAGIPTGTSLTYDGIRRPLPSTRSKRFNRFLIGTGVLAGLLLCTLLAMNVSKTAKLERSADLLQAILHRYDSLRVVNRSLASIDSVANCVFMMLQEQNARLVTMIESHEHLKRQHLFFSPKQRMIVLMREDLKKLDPNKTYELWAVVGKNPPIPVGKFKVDPKTDPPMYTFPLDLDYADAFGLSIEPENGGNKPQGEMMFLGNVPVTGRN